MNTNFPHEIYTTDADLAARLNIEHVTEQQMAITQEAHQLIGLSDLEVKSLSGKSSAERGKWLRKNRNRNRPCLCGSGKKFKKCCW